MVSPGGPGDHRTARADDSEGDDNSEEDGDDALGQPGMRGVRARDQ